nr:MAG TPA: hypothetical protein [Caudoviricetes sp.]
MKYEYSDGGRSKYFKAKGVGDCAIRAVAIATQTDYLEVYNAFKKLNGGKSCRDGTPKVVDKKYLTQVGAVKINMNVPAGKARWHVTTIDKVMGKYPHIRYVLQVSKHLIAGQGDTIYDIFDDRPRDKGIYVMWLTNATQREAKEIQSKVALGDIKRICL